MEHKSVIEKEVAHLIVDAVDLEVGPEDIDPLAPLFGDGLGLDSIDMLEIALSLSQRYGLQMRSDDPETVKNFACLRALSSHIEKKRVR
jgi:acyl carrier protein